MIKLSTPVVPERSRVKFSYEDRILLLGSCFSDNIGQKLSGASFSVLANPFGTLYNPLSVVNALQRLSSGVPFSEEDCVEMGSGAGLVCSFSHHTSFARETKEEFLSVANESLARSSAFFGEATVVVLTLGTAWYYLHGETPVANCLKRDPREFSRKLLSVGHISSLLERAVEKFSRDDPSGRWKGKRFIFTVSPIRHMADSAHGNLLSKSSLILGVEEVVEKYRPVADYFPSYEIMMDELRDYRFYAEDLVHPSKVAVDIIWEKFLSFALEEGLGEKVLGKERETRRSLHRPMHG